MKYTCILFDIDDTIVRSDPLRAAAIRRCGGDLSLISDDQLRSQSPPKVLRVTGSNADMSDYWRAWRSELRESGRLSDDSLPSVLYELQQRDLSLGIVTSLPSSPAAAVLRHFGISSYFGGCVVTYATCSRRKPHADPIIHAMGQLRHPAAGTLYVGDSANDVEASKAAGVHFGLVDWSLADDRHDYEKAADVVLKSFADLLDMSG